MKHLRDHMFEYLLGNGKKCLPKDIGLSEDSSREDICSFLEANGFEEVQCFTISQFDTVFVKSSHPVFWCGKFSNAYDKWIRFGNGGKITSKNPVFFWRLNDVHDAPRWQVSNWPGSGVHNFESFKEFISYAIETLGLQ